MSSGAISSSSKSSTSSSSTFVPQTPRKSMEEIWKELSLSSALHQDILSTPSISAHNSQHHHHQYQSFHATNPTTTTTSISFSGITPQDFLSGSFRYSNPLTPAEPQPPTALSLNSGQFRGYPNSSSSISTGDASTFCDAINCSLPLIGLAAHCPKSNAAEQQRSKSLDHGMDHKKQRLMKNRESASRSRARKQAYTHELELEVARLSTENTKIKRQYEQLRKKMEAQDTVTAKSKLQRTSTAPF